MTSPTRREMTGIPGPLITWLFVTSIDPDELSAAAQSGADCVIVDLEDFTPPQLREEGRSKLPETLRTISKAGPLTCVRVNPTVSVDHDADVEAALEANAEVVALPKTTSAQELHDLRAALGDGSSAPALLPNIETAEGLVHTYEILKYAPPLIGCLVASEDMTASLKAPRDRSGAAIKYARERFLLECRAAGVEPVDCPYTWADHEGLVAETEHAKALGFHAKSAARADQIETIRRILEPSAGELAEARLLVDAFEAAQRDGKDRVEIDGRIAETPSYLNAKALLERAR